MSNIAEIKLFNDDVAGLVRRINKFIVELRDSQSRVTDDFGKHDQERLKSYIEAIRTYIAWVEGQPMLDLPKTHPTEVVIPTNPEIGAITNLNVIDLIRLLERGRDELLFGSDSSQRSSGFNKHDSDRVKAIIDKTEAYLTDYIEKITPLDSPETSTNAS
jgi:hypothetical protein